MERTPPAVLEVTGLGKSFGGLRAVDGLSFRVAAGETLALVGPNGSGKTTTFNVIAGSLAADTGRVTIDGRDVTRLSAERRAELGLARTFQNGRIFGNASVLENVLVARRARFRVSRPFAALRHVPLLRWIPLVAEALMAFVRTPAVAREWAAAAEDAERELRSFGTELAERGADRAYLLAYAGRRRLEIARALALGPRVLLLDEPAAGMNPNETAELAGHVETLRQSGLAIVVIEHKLDFIAQIAGRVIVLDGGRAVFDGPPAGARRDAAVIEAYIGGASRLAPPVPRVRTPGPALLELRNVNVSFGAIRALHDVSLNVEEGEIVCLLGANAAGKSTTMRTALGLVRPIDGSVWIGGRDRTGASTRDRIRAGLGSVPEGRHVFPAMSVEDNLLLGAATRRDRSVAEDALRMYDLFPRLRERRMQRAGTLSGGEQQMLATARALMGRPRLLCLDEPTMGLSPVLVDRVFDTLRELNAAGTTIFMVEQNANAALTIAHRGYVLRAGEIVMAGDSATLLTDSALRDAYLGGPSTS